MGGQEPGQAFTGLTRFLAPRDGSSLGYAQVQDTFTSLDAENRSLVNPSSVDFYHMQGNIEDHASNLPLVAANALKLVDNLRYMVGMEALYAAQAVDLRGKPTLGRVTGPVYDAFRKEVPFLDADRNLSIDIEKAYHFIADGRLDAVIRQADAN